METATTDLAAVMNTLQRIYGDASQTVLDQRAASAVMQTLRERGWASLQDVARVIASVPGQSVTLSYRAMSTDWTVHRVRDGHTDRVFVTAQR